MEQLDKELIFLTEKPSNANLSPLYLDAKLGRGFGQARGRTLREIYMSALNADNEEKMEAEFALAKEVESKLPQRI